MPTGAISQTYAPRLIGRLHYYVNAQRLQVVVVKFAPNNDENGMAKLSRVNYAMYSNFEITFERARKRARYVNILTLIHCRAIFSFVTTVKL